ncbi:MAG: hypothetical protein IPL32_12425 [Chloracidobacterium sp.]|nr:hypothetical protein [Chloracidobacterium sp.]
MRHANRLFLAIVFFGFLASVVSAQTTEFTYQGSLRDGVSAANGNYDFEFALFDALSGGAQLGSTLTRSTVAVANGIFAVQLDFGLQFTGASRFLEIRLRPTDNPGGYQQLLPRQAVNSAPYSVRSLNATTADSAVNATTANNSLQLGGVAANQFVVTTDLRMSDSRSPTAGSSNYIQNQNAGAQATSNFNISGSGTAGGTLSGGIVNATTQFSINGNRILSSTGTGNIFAGIGAGILNSTGINNTFVGASAGQANSTGLDNSFFGRSAGSSNTMGGGNSFFGVLAGSANSTGSGNAFFGGNAGNSNSTGGSNTFVGSFAGQSNTTASNNSFFGREAGISNTTGFNNTFVGASAGQANSTGLDNSFFGRSAGFSNTTGGNNSIFGVLAGDSNTNGGGNSFFGGNAGNANTTGSSNSFFGAYAGQANTTGLNNSFVGYAAGIGNTTGDNNTVIGHNANISLGTLNFATAIGSQSVANFSNSIYLGRPGGEDTVRIPGAVIIDGSLIVDTLGSTTGNVHLCRNTANRLSLCTSNFAEKTELETLRIRVAQQQALIEQLAKRLEQLEKKE